MAGSVDDRAFVVYALVETRPEHEFYGRVRYVGQTNNLRGRTWSYRQGYGSNPRLKNWLKSCSDFKVETLVTCTGRDAAWAHEIEQIKRFQTFRSEHGLNYHPGGKGGSLPGRAFTEQARKNMSASRRGKKRGPYKKRPRPVVVRSSLGQAISDAKKGVPFTERHKVALKQAQSRNRWQCTDCEFINIGRWVEEHLKSSGHRGKERVA